MTWSMNASGHHSEKLAVYDAAADTPEAGS